VVWGDALRWKRTGWGRVGGGRVRGKQDQSVSNSRKKKCGGTQLNEKTRETQEGVGEVIGAQSNA